MDHFGGRCWLDWWANPTINFGGLEIAVGVVATEPGWEAHGRLIDQGDEEREGFALLCDLNPVFTLRWEDGSTMPIAVRTGGEDGGFWLTEYDGPTDRAVDHQIDL